MPSDDLDSRGSRPSVSSGSVESSPKRWKLGDITPSRPCSHRATQSAVPCASDGVVDGRYGRSFGIEERHFYDTQASRSVNIRGRVVSDSFDVRLGVPYRQLARAPDDAKPNVCGRAVLGRPHGTAAVGDRK